MEELKLVSNFTDTEVARLIKIFNDIDIDRGGTISKDELFQLKAFHVRACTRAHTRVPLPRDACGMRVRRVCALSSACALRAIRSPWRPEIPPSVLPRHACTRAPRTHPCACGAVAVQANPFLSRIIHVSGERHSKRAGENDESDPDSLDIKEFAELMSVFSIRASREQKLRSHARMHACM